MASSTPASSESSSVQFSSVALDVGAAAADDGRLPLVGGPRGVGGEQTRLAVVDAADE